MSTRGSVGYIHKGEYNGTYNHSDSYPDGLGEEVVAAVRKIEDWEKFKANYEKLKWVPRDYKPTKAEIEAHKKWANLGVSEQKYEDVYCLLREMQGADLIPLVYEGVVGLCINNSDFIKDSLFCEYAYVLDLDNMMLEFYEGYQHEPQEGNRFGVEPEKEYYPCKLVAKFPLTAIPEDWMKQAFPPEEEEAEADAQIES